MSRKNSDSDSDGWTVVRREDEQASEGSSNGSIDFVKVENQESVSYHHETTPVAVEDLKASECVQERPGSLPTCGALSELNLHLTEEDRGVCVNTPPNTADTEAIIEAPLNLRLDEETDPKPTASFEVLSQVSVPTKDNDAPVSALEGQEVGCTDNLSMTTSPEEKHHTDSDSDHSDFVRLDPYIVEAEESISVAVGTGSRSGSQDDVMRLSDISTSSSSISSSFRFIHRSGMVLGAEQYVKRRMYRDNDTDSVQSDVDDRCESDISGVADDDLSSYSLGEVPISAENVPRSYKHRPNNNLNSTLTTLALVVLFAAVGIAVGHYMGTRSESRLRKQQVEKMQRLSDEYLICLQNQEELEDAMHEQTVDASHMTYLETEMEEYRSQCQRLQTIQENESDLDSQLLEEQLHELTEENAALKQRVGTLLYSQVANANAVTSDDDGGLVELSGEDVGHEIECGLGLQDEQREKEALELDPSVTQETVIEDLSIELVLTTAELEETRQNLAASDERLAEANQELARSAEELAEATDQLARTTEELEQTSEELNQTNSRLFSVEGIAHLWQSLFQLESERKQTENEKESTDVKSYLLTALDDIVVAFKSGLHNLTQTSKSQLELLRNLTQDQNLSDAINMKWKQLKEVIDGPTVQGATEKAKKLYSEIHSVVQEKIQHLQTAAFSETVPEDNSGKDLKEPVTDKVPGQDKKHHSENGQEKSDHSEKLQEKGGHFEKVMNRTKESVQILSEKINKTWHQVKDISSSVIKTVAPVVVKKSEAVAAKMESGWQKVKQRVHDGWYHKKRGSEKKPESNRAPQDGKKQNWSPTIQVDERKQYHGDPYWNSPDGDDDDVDSEFRFPKPHPKSDEFENKPDHKQRQSTPHHDTASPKKSNKKYEEFWGAVGFDPDDVFHDDFFEGNDRKWRKHEHRLRKLHGRIRKLNEDILFEMDDDEIEDLYDDLDDIDDDLDEEVQPSSLKMWLSCQIRWWKSRFQRKHRNDDLLQGCGRQLMNWQMKSSCSTPCKKGKKSCGKKKKSVSIHNSNICQQYFSSKATPVIKPETEVDNLKQIRQPNQNRDGHSKRNGKKDSRDDKKRSMTNGQKIESVTISYPDMPAPVIDDLLNRTAYEYPETISIKHGDDAQDGQVAEKGPLALDAHDGGDKSPEWLYARERALEYRMHKTDWMYQRAHDRDFQRRRPSDWQHERARDRELKHQQLYGKQ